MCDISRSMTVDIYCMNALEVLIPLGFCEVSEVTAMSRKEIKGRFEPWRSAPILPWTGRHVTARYEVSLVSGRRFLPANTNGAHFETNMVRHIGRQGLLLAASIQGDSG